MLLRLLQVREEHFVYLHGELEADLQELGAQIGGQSAVGFQCQLQLYQSAYALSYLLVGVSGDEGGIQLDGQHVEVAFELVLQGDALTQRREQGQRSLLLQLLLIDTLMQLAQMHLLPHGATPH